MTYFKIYYSISILLVGVCPNWRDRILSAYFNVITKALTRHIYILSSAAARYQSNCVALTTN